jgi:hypothetical protein
VFGGVSRDAADATHGHRGEMLAITGEVSTVALLVTLSLGQVLPTAWSRKWSRSFMSICPVPML